MTRFLDRMVERLYASLATGPVLACRPHASRQRIDLAQVARLDGRADEHTTGNIVRALLGEARELRLVPPVPAADAGDEARERYAERQAIIGKLRTIAEDARTYEQDTGAQVLYLGFPLLDVPPFGGTPGEAFGKRILAPICFVPVQLAVKATRPAAVTITCAREGAERVIANAALVAWIEQTTGKQLDVSDEAGADDDSDTWGEIAEVTRQVCEALGVTAPELTAETPVLATPRADERTAGEPRVIASAVLGLFPVSNQNLLKDLEAIASGEVVPDGPLHSFLRADRPLADDAARARDLREERLVADADPCQARAVRLAGSTRGLVIHGPPGTGKSQTIANIIGAHLARGERVLFVCDKRTAIDVVEHRLRHLGLGDLCAVIHDVQRDQRDLYRSVREQLESLVETKAESSAANELTRIDGELVRLHDELRRYHTALSGAKGRHLVDRSGGAQRVGSSDTRESHIDASRAAARKLPMMKSTEPVGSPSFHELVGEWLALSDARTTPEIRGVSRDDLMALERDVREVLVRGATAEAATNPWIDATVLPHASFAAAPADTWRAAVVHAREAAAAADATMAPAESDELPFDGAADLASQAVARAKLANELRAVERTLEASAIAAWAARDAVAVAKAAASFAAIEAQVARLEAAQPEPELALVARSHEDFGQLVSWIGALESYLPIARAWYRVFYAGRRKAAREVAERFGLPLTPESAERLARFLGDVRARRVVENWWDETITASGHRAPDAARELAGDDATLAATVRAYATLFAALAGLRDKAWTGVASRVRELLGAPADHARLLAALDRAASRSPTLQAVDAALAHELFAAPWRTQLAAAGRAGEALAPRLAALEDKLGSLDAVLRMKKALAALPPAVAGPVDALARAGVDDAAGWAAIRRGVLAAEIAARLAVDPALREVDADRISTVHARYRDLEGQKRALVRDAIRATWTARQRERLLASTGSRLNGAGAELKRRLALRGEKAMRMRQVIAAGAVKYGGAADEALGDASDARAKADARRGDASEARAKDARRSDAGEARAKDARRSDASEARAKDARRGDAGDARAKADARRSDAEPTSEAGDDDDMAATGGDPLFDLRPVWMASPETVAQIFPREALFDVVVFDEASQCRLEEALPVLVRAKRVVIAGDPQQLPPTRFFESAVARSDEGDGDLTDQGMFEEQQADVEDLLAAALNLEIEQCYLDVHYRSSNAHLIEFSNQNFYAARLQALPGHPRHRATTAPLRLVRVAGVYDQRANAIEAAAVVDIVRELLARPEPPSIGIACFNLVQRDLIVDALDEAAAGDAAFATALATARTRVGAASFEGLFVKNLENVQGDERDHIIISTTYGPDPQGRFYRRFGPLARAGGGRRLNVLVTRARSEVHLVTSIPASEYTALAPVEPGKAPNGAWLLYSYLQYAERLAQAYADEAERRALARPAGIVRTLPTRAPSQLVASLAQRLAAEGLTSDVYWGNDGFCVDLAIHHPERADDVTIGVLLDGARYDKVDDPVEWDLFRTAVLTALGWKLLRVWSPHLAADPAALHAAIHAAAARELEKERAPLPTARLVS